MEILERDKKIIWHPFTQEKTADLPIAIKKGKGAYIYDENGKEYLDLISSWWVNLHGHAHPEIAKSIYKQALELEHIIFAGFTHTPAVELCENLQKILPQKLSRFFFSDNGSTAVEVSLKMSYQYWHNKGKEKNIFISFDGGYHGDTFGAMSVSVNSGFHDVFKNLLFEVINIPFPETWDDDDDCQKKEEHSLDILKKELEKNGEKISAIILEPIIQGASGMRKCRASFVKKVITLVRQHGILVIFDEVMTGFGRTGTNFALEQIDVIPDFLCVSKGITGGFLPLALTITTEDIYNAFLNDSWDYAFAHGHSYTANPIACAAAITSLKILLEDDTQKALQDINLCHKAGIEYLKSNCTNVVKTRVIGTIAAFEVDCKKNINKELKAKFLDNGLLIRPLGNTVYILPPYCITKEELEFVYKKIVKILKYIV
ncbi:MAG: adenosylmethionine-8-amino-7-oxononanoate aminotransferase [Candidatus Midichloriaceae bacterium]|jgi:adenosylmethionine-8-amino-7-oxononanoate aminotransferase